MDATNTDGMMNLMIARRLLMYARLTDSSHGSHKGRHLSAKEMMKEDEAILSGQMPGNDSYGPRMGGADDNVQLHLSDLIRQLQQIRDAGQNPADGQVLAGMNFEATTVEVKTEFQEQLTLQYSTLEPVDGLVVRNKQLAETDRYAFEFSNGSTLKIIDKWSGKSTTIFGDPHVDVSDTESASDGDFKDLKASNSQTTFMLQDGTRLTFTAQDNGLIEAVDIFKDNQHVTGIGAASSKFNNDTGLFSTKVQTGSSSSSTLAMGDVVYAGGDGNDWFDSSQRLVWGKTTGPAITSRPSAVMTMEYRYRMTQQITVNHVEVNT
jgi:hypothetical protein